MRVLQKCVSVVFPDNTDMTECQYYIANGCGKCICNEEYIHVDNADGEEECIPWYLQAYIRLSSIR